jgi:hypothetical protein
MKDLLNFLLVGITTPLVYMGLCIVIMLSTFLIAIPISLGIYLANMAINLLLGV